MKKYSFLDDQIKEIKNKGLLIEEKIIKGPIQSKVKIKSKNYLNFCSNNYLGLANDKRLKKEAIKKIKKLGIGPAAVRTISGTTALHKNLEKKISKFKKVDDCILFQSGFCANLAVIPTLTGEGDLIFSDELNHASIIDACRLSRAQVIRYKHANPKDLLDKIKSNKIKKGNNRFIVTDGVFSMDGDIAPLYKLYQISEKHDAFLIVDDAHGEGVLGENGRGIVDHFDLHKRVDLEIGTLSKAFGVVGGYAAGNKKVISYLRQKARPYLFSSAPTIPDTAAAIKAIDIVKKSNNLITKLWSNTNYLKKNLQRLGFNIGKSETPIIPIILNDEKLTKNFSKKLFKNNLFAVAICYPTVALGKARIRIITSAAHTKDQLNQALDIFEEVGKEFDIIK